MKICVVDYQSGGNLFSVLNSLEHVGASYYLSSNPSEIAKSEKIFFPGVGSFAAAFASLESLNLREVILERIQAGVPFLGICLGMQLLFAYSTESRIGSQEAVGGLDVLPASVEKFSDNLSLKIPHMGWNTIASNARSPLFAGIEESASFYFVHSYRIGLGTASLPNLIRDYQGDNLRTLQYYFPKSVITSTNYGEDFLSAFWNGDNLFACQFHPEKSGKNGLRVLENFAKI